MDIRKIPVDAINPAVYNPRIDLQPDDKEYQRLKRSIEVSVVDQLMNGKGGETNWHRRNPDDLRS